MKKTDLIEIKKMDQKALAGKAKKVTEEILNLKLSASKSKSSNVKEVKNKRKELAQVFTILRQKQLLEKLEVPNGSESK